MRQLGSSVVPGVRNRKPRGRGLRTRTGCTTCRKRHVKCDERRPSCGPCGKGGRTCIYDVQRPAPSTTAGPSATQPTQRRADEQEVQHASLPTGFSEEQSPPVENASTQVSLENIQAASPKDAYIDPLLPLPDDPSFGAADTATVLTAADADESAPGSVNSWKPTATVSTATTRWYGLLADDAALALEAEARDDISSVPGSGSLRGFAKSLHAEGAIRNSIISPDQDVTDGSRNEQALWQLPEKIDLLPHQYFVFENFVRRISRWIDLFDPTCNFATLVPRLAMYNAGLMNAVLALSVRHLSLNPNIAQGRSYGRNDALQYYYETLHYVHKAMQFDSYKTSLELLATALILSTYEMLDGSLKDWERHLKGVFWIQRSQIIHGDSGGLPQAIWWAWLCQDVWAAFREKRKTFTFWKQSRTYDQLDAHELACRSVFLMAKVVNYCSEEEINASKSSLPSRSDKADSLLGILDEWQECLPVKFAPLPVETTGSESAVFRPIWIHPPAFGVAIQLNYAARILVYLHRPSSGGLNNYLQQQKELARCVDTICGIAKPMTDDAASLMCAQCLSIAGMCVQDSWQREAVLELIALCRQRTGWPIKPLGEELQSLWGNRPQND